MVLVGRGNGRGCFDTRLDLLGSRRFIALHKIPLGAQDLGRL